MKKTILTLALSLMSILFFAQDFANYSKYEKDNVKVKSQSTFPNAVFMGDSITEGWVNSDPKFFSDNNFVGRGISGQTTSQMLLRFREDVINLHPKKVIILAGTNDIAENQGKISHDKILGNIISMVELAKANKIKVVLCSVLPAYEFWWRTGLQPAEKVVALNKLLKEYAQKNKISYVEYFDEMKDERNGLPKLYADDEVHPNIAGYKKMEEILMKTLK
ncbi:acylneuraminate cytidylyltransferase [Cloacibacterium rupense]|uniref:Acylneuraminate cytidylyltransferase n=1 Tax=Cloacibacterium rupense TaxID=517423 RepID=A0ABQ2NK71_9FLAO|nr:SGNH/GDSL hydrolase family protein [Cloacibacterium rupense]GGP05427.1 acylneuraminate cytidylyltransferase [Cloacibacterium rupense]